MARFIDILGTMDSIITWGHFVNGKCHVDGYDILLDDKSEQYSIVKLEYGIVTKVVKTSGEVTRGTMRVSAGRCNNFYCGISNGEVTFTVPVEIKERFSEECVYIPSSSYVGKSEFRRHIEAVLESEEDVYELERACDSILRCKPDSYDNTGNMLMQAVLFAEQFMKRVV